MAQDLASRLHVPRSRQGCAGRESRSIRGRIRRGYVTAAHDIADRPNGGIDALLGAELLEALALPFLAALFGESGHGSIFSIESVAQCAAGRASMAASSSRMIVVTLGFCESDAKDRLRCGVGWSSGMEEAYPSIQLFAIELGRPGTFGFFHGIASKRTSQQ